MARISSNVIQIPVVVSIGNERMGHAEMRIDVEISGAVLDGQAIAGVGVVRRDKLLNAYLEGDTPQFLRLLADKLEDESAEPPKVEDLYRE